MQPECLGGNSWLGSLSGLSSTGPNPPLQNPRTNSINLTFKILTNLGEETALGSAALPRCCFQDSVPQHR